MPQIDDWRWCRNCSALFFIGVNRGVCPATGSGHDPTGSKPYLLDNDNTVGEDCWRWCSHCQMLHYMHGNGHCSGTGSKHETQKSHHYSLYVKAPQEGAFIEGWRACKGCQCLWLPADGGNRCSKGGHHDGTDSAHYFLKIE